MKSCTILLLFLVWFSVRARAATTVSLSISRQPSGDVLVTWPVDAVGFILQERISFSVGHPWETSQRTPTESGGQLQVVVDPVGESTYFQLAQTQTEDVPDPQYLDTNGDGIDGTVS